MKRGQQALEFLVTYGWMLMIVIMVAGGLVYFGVFDTSKLLPQECVLNLDFYCDRFALFENGTARIDVVNNLGEPVTSAFFSCEYANGARFSSTTLASDPWLPGDVYSVECNPVPYDPMYLPLGEREQVDLILTYKKVGGSFHKTVNGKMIATVSASN